LNITSHHPHAWLLKTASLASVAVAGVLILAKTFAWWYTQSLSLQASLVDSLLDILASLVNLFVIRQALKPADEDHRFGHGKAEALGSLAQTTFIMGSALWLMFDVLHRIAHPQQIEAPQVGIIVMILSIVLTGALILFQRYVIRLTDSMAIKADSLHYQTDLYTNAGVLISLFLASSLHLSWIDVAVAGFIIIYIIITSVQIGLKALDVLMDRELSDETRERIMEIAKKHSLVLDVHELRTRTSGTHLFIQLHLDMSENLSLKDAHNAGDEVSEMIQGEFPNADIIVHHDPRPDNP
jgi:ferrous-iron efflux pump FieF